MTERLLDYLAKHYGLIDVPMSVQTRLKELNNGTSKKYKGVTITYDCIASMLRYYERELFELYKYNIARGKCKTRTERVLYDISVMADWVDKYENRPEVRYNKVVHSQTMNPQIDGGEKIFNNAKRLAGSIEEKKKKDKELALEAEQVLELLRELDEMEREDEE